MQSTVIRQRDHQSPLHFAAAQRASRLVHFAWMLAFCTGACGAKTGLLVPRIRCNTDVPTAAPDATCGYVQQPPIEQPTQRIARARTVAGGTWCEHTHSGSVRIEVPAGFCASVYARIRGPRMMAMSRDGVLFVSSPSTPTAGGSIGDGFIYRLTDPNRSGTAEVQRYLPVPDVHGLALSENFLYFTQTNRVMRTPYTAQQTQADPASVAQIASLPVVPLGRWTHSLAIQSDGRMFVTEGRLLPHDGPNSAQIFEVTANGLVEVSRGLRNPTWIRCHPTEPMCWATECSQDGIPQYPDKFYRVRPCTDYGAQLCDRPLRTDAGACPGPTMPEYLLPQHSTPFGFDFEPGTWPEPYRDAIFLAKHGTFYGASGPGEGTGVYVISRDRCTNQWTNDVRLFASGFETPPRGSSERGRATEAIFAPDGRLFVGDDTAGVIYWIAPITLPR